MATWKDDRAPEELLTHDLIVLAHDTFMSGWGQAQGRKSYAGWACQPKDVKKVLAWVQSREEMQNIRVVTYDFIPPDNGHYHIYVVRPNHPSLEQDVQEKYAQELKEKKGELR